MLSREHGCDLCYSPMIHARLYSERDEAGRLKMFETVPEDRPLVVQFCGHDPQVECNSHPAPQLLVFEVSQAPPELPSEEGSLVSFFCVLLLQN